MGTLKPLTLFDPAFDVPSVFKGLLPPMWMEAERMAPVIKLDVEEAADRYLVKADVPAFGVLDHVIAAGIAKGRLWARFAGVAMAALLLIAVPVGTILGIIALMGLLGRDARDWFGTAKPVYRTPLVPPPAV